MIRRSAIDAFLDNLASPKATPGGGSAAAIMAAMGAALVSMVCNLTIGKKNYHEFDEELKSTRAKAEQLRRELTEMIDADVQAFDAVMRAYGMPRQTQDEAATRIQVIQTALKTATLVPLRCARACAEVISLAAVVAEKGNRTVVSDAGVGVLAAFAALRSAGLNVLTNARLVTDSAFAETQLAELDQLLSKAASATEACYQVVKERLG